MENLILSVTAKQSELVQELLEKILGEQEVVASSATSAERDVKKAQFTSECIKLLLGALQQGKTTVEAPGLIMKPILSQLKTKLESQMAIMMDLMQDQSLVSENQLQVFTRGIELLHIMHAMTHEALQVKSEAV